MAYVDYTDANTACLCSPCAIRRCGGCPIGNRPRSPPRPAADRNDTGSAASEDPTDQGAKSAVVDGAPTALDDSESRCSASWQRRGSWTTSYGQ